MENKRKVLIIVAVAVLMLLAIILITQVHFFHSWDNGVVVRGGTCKENGIREFTCVKCGETRSEVIYTTENHSYGPWNWVKEATCETSGEQVRTCLLCGKQKKQNILSIGHSYSDWVVVQTANCVRGQVNERTCENCGKTETHTDYARGDHQYEDWVTVKEKTCTEDGLKECECRYCYEKETEVLSAAGHSYVNGICTVCEHGWINIALPETPVIVNDYYGSRIDETCKITSFKIVKIEGDYYLGEREYEITFSWAGEKIYDDDGNNYSSSCGFGFKIFDSEGYVVCTGSTSSVQVSVGEKFRDQTFRISSTKFDPSETYTLKILNLD